jgi:hypothetical protein
MLPPIDRLKTQYALIGQTIDNSLARLSSKGAEVDQEGVVIQGAYLFGVRAFEYFIESQMINLCHPDAIWGPKSVNGQNRRYIRKLSDTSAARIKALILMGQPYADYLPYERTLKRAAVLFAKGRPFSLVGAEQKDVINRSFVVRNLIAHESEHSLKRFTSVICARYPLRADRRHAVGYLLYEAQKGTPMAKQDLAGLFSVANFLS